MQIFKLLPGTNCRECGSPSCLAFAMKIAAGKDSHDKCPHIIPESSAKLEEMMEPPIIELTLERGGKAIKLGGEKVLYRHDETFYNPTAFAVRLAEDNGQSSLKEKIRRIEELTFERVGMEISVDMLALIDEGSNSDFAGFAYKVYSLTRLPLLIGTDPQQAEKILEWENREGIILLFKQKPGADILEKIKNDDITIAIESSNYDEALNNGTFLRENNIKRGIIGIRQSHTLGMMDLLYRIREEALVKKNRFLGFPTLVIPGEREKDLFTPVAAVARYGNAVVLNTDDPDHILPLLTLRQNIFTDPRRPIQVEAKLYRIGDVGPDSPMLVTTNFSLTYFTVAQEIEASRIPAYLLIVDTDGTSVLTAWAADKFNGKIILKAVKEAEAEEILSKKEMIISGYVAMLKEEIEEQSDWRVLTGPGEASGIPQFLRKIKAD